jgi:hypothetical protein
MSRIILHVGTHKTATTTLQDTCAANRRRLAAHGVIFPEIGPTNGQHTLVTRWIPLPPRFCDPRPALEHWQALARRHAGGEATILVSSEEFSRCRPAVDMAELGRLVAPFGRRTVVCVLRNQLAYLQSIYLQVSQTPGVAGFESFLAEALLTNLATGVQLDYGALYDRLLAGFAPGRSCFSPTRRRSPHRAASSARCSTGSGSATPAPRSPRSPPAIPTSRPRRSPPGPPARSPRRRSRRRGWSGSPAR